MFVGGLRPLLDARFWACNEGRDETEMHCSVTDQAVYSDALPCSIYNTHVLMRGGHDCQKLRFFNFFIVSGTTVKNFVCYCT